MRAAVWALMTAMVVLPALAADYTLNLAAGESTAIEMPGATAAYAIDPTIADASISTNRVVVVAHSVGTTQIVVVSAAGTRTIALSVKSRAAASGEGARDAQGPERGTYELRYASGGGQLQNAIDLSRTEGSRRQDFRLVTTTSLGERFAGEPSSVIRSISYRVTTPRRQLTFFDEQVNHSPLTVNDAIVRGLHLRQDGWRLHAGYTTNAAFGSLFLPSQRDLVLGGGYELRLSDRARLTPSVFAYPTQHGSVVSLLYDYARAERLEASAELGYSRGLGAAGHLLFAGEENRLRADFRYQPRQFAIVGPSKLQGFYSDASWSTRLGSRFTADLAGSANHYELPRFDQRSLTANGEARYALTRPLSILAGFSFGSFSGSGISQPVRSTTIPVGLQFDSPRFGTGLVVRYGTNSATNRGSRGFRATVRARVGAVTISGYLDEQTEAPTLELILRDDPALALALQQLGIAATTPEEIARVLRTNAELINLGFIEGATVNLAPARTQAGLEAAWMGDGVMRPQLRMRLLLNRTEGVASGVTTTLATVNWSQRLTGSTDLYAGVTLARTMTSRTNGPTNRTFFEAGVRRRFDSLPHFGGSGTISGRVFLDEGMTGEPTNIPADGITVTLDGDRTLLSSADGRFAFSDVPAGSHRVTAQLGGTAYFTTASSADARPGETVSFGIASSPARLIGRVTDDSGAPMPRVAVALVRGTRQFTATTGMDGGYAIAAAPGEYDLTVLRESLPPGVTFDSAALRHVALARAEPQQLSLVVRINRSVGGRVAGSVPGDGVTIPSLGRSSTIDQEGRYLFRSLPAGDITIVARSAGRTMTRQVSVPHEPTALNDIDLGVPTATVAALTESPAITADATAASYVIQLGAFHDLANAEQLQGQARAAGVEVTIATLRSLAIVQSRSYPSPLAAHPELSRLKRAGLRAIIVRR